MSIYKGMLMLGGYLTHVEHLEDASRNPCPEAPEARPAGGRRVASPRTVPALTPVSEGPGCVAGGCC
ncbi:hypothetical protein [Corallococcus llansteffanensis]|uniref:Uncharacterized protein n=1 Tax=Corallococcus llansteffanensis TaxID=2316731 RepID=A0A3A8NX88_9BACT|nr:hypothetical protein [Corallococcus llansteffanensis]RKH48986.1 hypothetical protein D7V93_32505 [Corallococcus llansteffanensis]